MKYKVFYGEIEIASYMVFKDHVEYKVNNTGKQKLKEKGIALFYQLENDFTSTNFPLLDNRIKNCSRFKGTLIGYHTDNISMIALESIKNIIFDVGGILFDDSIHNINKLLKKDSTAIYKKAYGEKFKKCLNGQLTVTNYLKELENDPDYQDLKQILAKENLYKSYPLIEENLNYIKKLKQEGYNLYLLTNITEESYNYIDEVINISSIFSGGVYSYQEKMMKPNEDIFKLIMHKYNLNYDETIFFDDKMKNITAAYKTDLIGYQFKTIDDIKSALN